MKGGQRQSKRTNIEMFIINQDMQEARYDCVLQAVVQKAKLREKKIRKIQIARLHNPETLRIKHLVGHRHLRVARCKFHIS